MRGRGRLVLLLWLAVIASGLWYERHRILTSVGRLLVADDPLEPVDAIVVSQTSGREDAFEAAGLYRDGLSSRIVLPIWARDPLDDEVRRLGIPFLSIPDLARAILERSGVPPAAIVPLPAAADGSDTEVTAVAEYLRATGVASVIYVAPRTHGARIRWMLRRRLPPGTRITVRGPRTDDFAPDAWWRSRDQSREVMSESLRWLNSVLLGDAWRQAPSTERTTAHCSSCPAAAEESPGSGPGDSTRMGTALGRPAP